MIRFCVTTVIKAFDSTADDFCALTAGCHNSFQTEEWNQFHPDGEIHDVRKKTERRLLGCLNGPDVYVMSNTFNFLRLSPLCRFNKRQIKRSSSPFPRFPLESKIRVYTTAK